MFPDLTFTAQSAALRVWIGALSPQDRAAPSSLPGWSVAQLVGHLVGVHDGVAALRPVEPAPHTTGDNPGGDEDSDRGRAPAPLTVADYVSGYQASAGGTADVARTIARDTAEAPLRAWDEAAEQARRTLAALGAADRLVATRRGPMMTSAYLITRVIELVVHGDDLHRSLPHLPAPPVLGSARALVVTALREVLTARDADPAVLAAASALDEREFVDLTTGRVPVADAHLPEALAAVLPLL